MHQFLTLPLEKKSLFLNITMEIDFGNSSIFSNYTTLRNETLIKQRLWAILVIDDTWRILFGVLHVVAGIPASLLNAVVIVAMFKGKALQENSCRILCALAITDFITGLSGFLTAAESFDAAIRMSPIAIALRVSINFITLLSSINFTGFVSFDRYLHMSRLKAAYKMPRYLSNLGIAMCWLTSLATSIITQIIKSDVVLILPSVITSVDLIIVIICYIFLIKSLRNFTRESSGGALDAKFVKNEKYATQTIIIISSCFIVMNFPIFLGFLLRARYGLTQSIALFNTFAKFLSFSNSLINPILYCGRTRSIQKDLKNFLPWTQNSVSQNSSVHRSEKKVTSKKVIINKH